MFFIFIKLAFVFETISVNVNSLTMTHIRFPLTFIHISIWVNHSATMTLLVIDPCTVIHSSIPKKKFPGTPSLSLFPLTYIYSYDLLLKGKCIRTLLIYKFIRRQFNTQIKLSLQLLGYILTEFLQCFLNLIRNFRKNFYWSSHVFRRSL